MTFQVGRRTRSPRRKPSGFSVGPRPPEVPGSDVDGAHSWVNSSRAWTSVISSFCYRQGSVGVHLRGCTEADSIKIWLLNVRHVIFKFREVRLGVIMSENTNGELFAGCSYLGYKVWWLPSVSYLVLEHRTVAFHTANGRHELRLPPLALLTFVEMVLRVCEWPRAACRAESWILHRV